MFFITIYALNAGSQLLKKIKEAYPGIWLLPLVLEIIYFITLIAVKIFYKATTNTGIYHADFLVILLSGCIVTCHYCWFFLRKLN
jgi:hypothetical protein